MRVIRQAGVWVDLVAGTILLLCLANGNAASVNDGPWLPIDDIRLADNGDLIGWRVGGLDAGTTELVEPGESLLVLRLFAGDLDVSEHITWRRMNSNAEGYGEFVGSHTGLGLEIHRTYHADMDRGTIDHQVRIVSEENLNHDNHRAQVILEPALRKHAPNDGSLGDFFYGFTRIFAIRPDGESFERVHEQDEAAAAAVVTRHVALIIMPDLSGEDVMIVHPDSGATLAIDNREISSPKRQVIGAIKLNASAIGDTPYRSFLYSDMSSPMRGLARLIEHGLLALQSATGNAGAAIIVFAVLLRIVLLPLGLWAIRQQRRFAMIQQQMKPKIQRINETLKGATKSEEILKTYKQHGISPFSGLKGSLGLFVQLPILMALFAVTTESAMFRDAPFLWTSDLSLPDRTVTLAFSIPGFGRYVNFLPIFLGIICTIAALIQARSTGAGNSPRSGLILALVFVLFFYPCAAALVLYWAIVNVSQIFEGLYVTKTGLSQNMR